MSLRYTLPGVSLVAALGCATHAGNDESLRPVALPGPQGSGTFSVQATPGVAVAAFAAERTVSGWTLRFLGSSDGPVLPAHTRAAERGPRPLPPIPGTQRPRRPNELCAIGLPTVPDAHNQSTPSYDWGCSQFLGDAMPLPRWVAGADPMPAYRYVVLISSTERLSEARWQALADSLSAISQLSAAPGRLGRLAFGGAPDARWMAALAGVPEDAVPRWTSVPSGTRSIPVARAAP